MLPVLSTCLQDTNDGKEILLKEKLLDKIWLFLPEIDDVVLDSSTPVSFGQDIRDNSMTDELPSPILFQWKHVGSSNGWWRTQLPMLPDDDDDDEESSCSALAVSCSYEEDEIIGSFANFNVQEETYGKGIPEFWVNGHCLLPPFNKHSLIERSRFATHHNQE